jgi:hypothetical protein
LAARFLFEENYLFPNPPPECPPPPWKLLPPLWKPPLLWELPPEKPPPLWKLLPEDQPDDGREEEGRLPEDGRL